MSRTAYPFHSDDISLLARSLVKQWAEQTEPPGHVQMLNMLARAVGYQNFQHFRSEAEARPAIQLAPPPLVESAEPPSIGAAARKLLRHFDEHGRLHRWPSKFSEQGPCLWPIWARIPAHRTMTEREVNEYIKLGEVLGDHVLLRRELVNYKLLERTLDGREYRRLEQAPSAVGLDLIRHFASRV
ncbi:DUF2087 domain-containing protein [Parachitinimonas caeni]|uniref:DUF2087 domain-containing protein n=1 Tax=Parachitinimonas caeni TaxID=3031301 RepID=A0ABT7E3R0_9NEIS|nr:DUF2087 domain-containing protein [Parachitinimonas caeni]MDK2126951.1 DUF2087 domain-containing protein [Parachitinimonas caeni]